MSIVWTKNKKNIWPKKSLRRSYGEQSILDCKDLPVRHQDWWQRESSGDCAQFSPFLVVVDKAQCYNLIWFSVANLGKPIWWFHFCVIAAVPPVPVFTCWSHAFAVLLSILWNFLKPSMISCLAIASGSFTECVCGCKTRGRFFQPRYTLALDFLTIVWRVLVFWFQDTLRPHHWEWNREL